MDQHGRPVWHYRQCLPELFLLKQIDTWHEQQSKSAVHELQHFRLGPLAFTCHSFQKGLLEKWAYSLKPLRVTESDEDAWNIFLWDDKQAGLVFHTPPGDLRHCAFQRLNALTTSSIRQFYQGWLGVYSGISLNRRVGYYVVDDHATSPIFERVTPMRPILNVMLNQYGLTLAHAASIVNTDGRSLVLAGGPNQGKSTTALRWLIHGGCAQGDDVCVLGKEGPSSFMVTQGLKMRTATEAFFPQLQAHLTKIIEGGETKNLFWMDQVFPQQHALHAQVQALLLPEVSGEVLTRVEPASPIEAMRAVVPYANQQVPTSDNLMGDILMRFIKLLPAFKIRLGTCSDHVLETLHRLFANPQTFQK
ncbi:MAG: hypothetical protein ACFCU3_01610 [Verrucomicrobiales bacterium]